MKLEITITDRNNGQFVTYQEQTEGWGEGADYLWQEGNFSCDCNRGLFFGRHSNPPFESKTVCGMERYTVCIKDALDGKILYRD